MSQKFPHIDDIILLKPLGKGAFGEVYLSKKINSNKLYATKRISRASADKPRMKRYLTYEIKILGSLKHPNIVKLEDLKKTDNHYYIVMEYINGGDLASYLEKYKQKYKCAFPEYIVQYLMKQIVEALAYIHDNNIIHRDLKLDNIMVGFDNDKDKEELNLMKAKIKIIDFGFAIILPTKDSLATTLVGTFAYMDPKNLYKYYEEGKNDKSRGYGTEADIWSLGCLCFELFRGKKAFEAKTSKELVEKIKTGLYRIPKTASNEITSFLDKMLKYDSNNRLSARELMNHPFLTKHIYNANNIEENKEPKMHKEEHVPSYFKDNVDNYKQQAALKKIKTLPEKKKSVEINSNKNQINNETYNRTNTYTGPISLYGQQMSSSVQQPSQHGMFSIPMNNQFSEYKFQSNSQQYH